MVQKRIGKYRLKKLLWHGRNAEVYIAENTKNKTLFAIKLLHESFSDQQIDQHMKQKFLEEAKKLASLKHPGIVDLIEVSFEQDMRPYFVMTYASGGSLRHKHPRNSQLSLETIHSYTNQIATALAYAHEHNVIHCDVKPENILLAGDGHLLLSDFGISRISESTLPQSTRDPFGTATYMAPEQFKGRWSEASDQYALAIMVYEWFCGQPPFSGENRNRLMDCHLSTPVPSLREACAERRDDIPDDTLQKVEVVILKALEKNSQERFSSIHEFAQALNDALRDSGLINHSGRLSGNINSAIEAFVPAEPGNVRESLVLETRIVQPPLVIKQPTPPKPPISYDANMQPPLVIKQPTPPKPPIPYGALDSIGGVVGVLLEILLIGVALSTPLNGFPPNGGTYSTSAQAGWSNACELLYVAAALTGLICAIIPFKYQIRKVLFVLASFVLAAIFFSLQYFVIRPQLTQAGQIGLWGWTIGGSLFAVAAGFLVAGIGRFIIWCIDEVILAIQRLVVIPILGFLTLFMRLLTKPFMRNKPLMHIGSFDESQLPSSMLDRRLLRDLLELALGEARHMHKDYLGTPHLFIALTGLEGGRTQDALRGLGYSPGQVSSVFRLALGSGNATSDTPILPTRRCKEILQNAERNAINANSQSIDERAIAQAVLSEGDGITHELLTKLGINPSQLVALILAEPG